MEAAEGGTPSLAAGLCEAWRLESGQWSQVLHAWSTGDDADDAHCPAQPTPPPWPPGVEEAVRSCEQRRESVELKVRREGDTSAPEVTLKLAPQPPEETPLWEVGRGVWVVSTARVVEAYVPSPPPSSAFAGGGHAQQPSSSSSWRYAGSGKGVERPAEAAGEQQSASHHYYWTWAAIPPQRVPCTELKLKVRPQTPQFRSWH
jgi:hypothetical protein